MTGPVDPDPAVDWRPTVADVAALLRARTKDNNGAENGTFTDETRPTATQVEILITNGCADVSSWVGYSLNEALWAEARNLASIYAAVQVEESYYPEQVSTQRSAWAQLWERYQFGIKQFVERAGATAEIGSVAAREGSILTPGMTLASQWFYWNGGWPMTMPPPEPPPAA